MMVIRQARRLVVARGLILVLLLSGCGIYGEKGFWYNGTLNDEDFLEESNELCEDVFAERRDSLAVVANLPTLGEAEGELLEDISRELDDLSDDFDELKGSDGLEATRDALVATWTTAADDLDEVADAIDDDPGPDREQLTATVALLRDAEAAAMTSGLSACAPLGEAAA